MMILDLIGSILITVSASIAISTLAIQFGASQLARFRIVAGLALWFVFVVVLAATSVLHDRLVLGVPGLGLTIFLPMVVLAVTTLRSPILHQRLESVPLGILISVNTIRVFGALFVVLYTVNRLPALFALVAGWGDVIVGLTAIPVAWLVHKKDAAAYLTALVWNTLGILDLIAAIGLGVTSSPGPLQVFFSEPTASMMTTLPWLLIPAFLVPLLASSHLAVFYRLRRDGSYSGVRQGVSG